MKVEPNERVEQPPPDDRRAKSRTASEALLAQEREDTAIPRGGRPWGHWLHAYGLVLAWVAVIIGFGIAVPSTFLTLANFRTIFSIQAALVILSLALVVPLAAGEFDLSVAGSLGISYVLVGYLNANMGWPILPVVVIAILAALAVGVTNGLLVVWLGLDSIVVTLGTGTVLVGLGYAMLNGPAVGVSSALVNVATFPLGGLAIAFWIAVLATVVMWYVFRFTSTGRYTYFVGANREAARLAGISVNRIRAGSLVIAATLAGADGILLAGTNGSADPTTAGSYLLAAFAAVFLGGTAITPGRFNPWGTFIAVYFLATGVTGLELLGQTGWVEQVFYGVALVIGVVASRVGARRVAR